jgi:ABC-type glutathione transport system ATPase component
MPAEFRATTGDGQAAVEVRGLRKIYPGGVEAVRGIDFQVAPGEVLGLLGPNGAGKTTTIGMLTTTIKPTSGSARLAGFDVAREPIAARLRQRHPDRPRRPGYSRRGRHHPQAHPGRHLPAADRQQARCLTHEETP